MEKINKYLVDLDCYYDPENHFWIKIDGKMATIGMSPLVQETNGSFVAIAFNQNPELGKGGSFGNIEAEKHVGPLISPVSGLISERNEKVIENPRLINTDPYGDGWLLKLHLNNFEMESGHLISGEDDIKNWFNAELKKFDEKGWIAQ